MYNIMNKIIKMHSNCSGFDADIPTTGRQLSQTGKDRSGKNWATNKLNCLILLPLLLKRRTASQRTFWPTSPAWPALSRWWVSGGEFLLLQLVLCVSAEHIAQRLHHLDLLCTVGTLRLSAEKQRYKMLRQQSSTLLKIKAWLIKGLTCLHKTFWPSVSLSLLQPLFSLCVQPFPLTPLLGFPDDVQPGGESLYGVYQTPLAVKQRRWKTVLLKAPSADLKQKKQRAPSVSQIG